METKLQKHRELWKGQTDEWLFERLTRELSQKVETIHGLLDEKTQLQADKEELLEALEEVKQFLNYIQSPATPAIRLRMKIESIIKKHKS